MESPTIQAPIVVIGLGGTGSRLAIKATKIMDTPNCCLQLSNDTHDLVDDVTSIHMDTSPVINPTAHLVRAATYKAIDKIDKAIQGYNTAIVICNLAGKAGTAIAPVISDMCKKRNMKRIVIAIMPFGYEKEKIFASGVALKRLREASNNNTIIVLDNDSIMQSNPDLSPAECYNIGDAAIMHVLGSLGCSEVSSGTSAQTSILATSRSRNMVEESLKDALKMLYGTASPNTIKKSILYVAGGKDTPTRVLASIDSMTKGFLDTRDAMQNSVVAGDAIEISSSSRDHQKRVVMLSSVQGLKKFDKYDPLGVIPKEQTLDWNVPECSIGDSLSVDDNNSSMTMYQIE